MAKIKHNESGVEFKYGDILQLYKNSGIGQLDFEIQTQEVAFRGGISYSIPFDDVANIKVPLDQDPNEFWTQESISRLKKYKEEFPDKILYTDGNLGICYTKEDLGKLLEFYNIKNDTNFTFEHIMSKDFVCSEEEFTAGMILMLSSLDEEENWFYEVDYEWVTNGGI